MSRRFLVTLLVLVVGGYCLGGPCRAAGEIPTDWTAYNATGLTMVPFRALLSWMGAQVKWNAAERRVDALRGGVTVTVWVGRTDAQVNGQAQTVDAAPTMIHDRTFVPLRFIAEALGAHVAWNPRLRQVSISDHGEVGTVFVPRGGPVIGPVLGAQPPLPGRVWTVVNH
jgi:hypothetical protein